MLNFLSNYVFSTVLTTQLLIVGSLYTNSAEAAARRCSIRTLVEESARAENTSSFFINDISGVEKIKLKPATITKLKKVFDDKGWELSATKIKEVIEGGAEMIKGNSRTPSIERSNEMAALGKEILKAAKADLNKEQTKMVTYMIAESVMRLEAIKTSDYKTGEALPVFKKKSTLHIDKFHDLVESYVDGTTGYADLPQDGGFLSWPEIRGLYANNSWAIGLRDHDMYHLHYSYGHPYYLAVNLHSSRSINDRRYILISALWESVDTFRTGLESSISSYYKNKNMTAEEGMLDLGSATKAELAAIEAVVGSHQNVSSYGELAHSAGWRPTKTKFGRTSINVSEATLQKEIVDYINESVARLKVAANKKYAKYHRQGPGVTVTTSEEAIPGY
ncbi:MAG: hypothetical protein ABL930_08755 [Pseudobdellovibrio sp.]